MICGPHRVKGGAAQLGAQVHGEPGPFGTYADDSAVREEPAEHGQVLAVPAGPEAR